MWIRRERLSLVLLICTQVPFTWWEIVWITWLRVFWIWPKAANSISFESFQTCFFKLIFVYHGSGLLHLRAVDLPKMQLHRCGGRYGALSTNSLLYFLFSRVISRSRGGHQRKSSTEIWSYSHVRRSSSFDVGKIHSSGRHNTSLHCPFQVTKLKVRILHFLWCRRVVIYSHGNAADIGCCIDYMEILGRELDCDFIFYDYEGYGYSGGEARCRNLPRDLRAVYNYARTLFPATSIYLAGESSTNPFFPIMRSWQCAYLCRRFWLIPRAIS